MGGYGSLPVTGMASLAVAGVVIGAPTLAIVAVGLVLAGALLLRLGWRRRQPVDRR